MVGASDPDRPTPFVPILPFFGREGERGEEGVFKKRRREKKKDILAVVLAEDIVGTHCKYPVLHEGGRDNTSFTKAASWPRRKVFNTQRQRTEKKVF